jgi:hypothetical protein
MKSAPKKRLRLAINLSIDPALVEQARAIAQSENRSLSNLVETLIQRELSKSVRAPKAPRCTPRNAADDAA